jgi:hypothetical protein
VTRPDILEAFKLARTYVHTLHSTVATATGHERTVVRPDLEKVDAAILALEAEFAKDLNQQ